MARALDAYEERASGDHEDHGGNSGYDVGDGAGKTERVSLARRLQDKGRRAIDATGLALPVLRRLRRALARSGTADALEGCPRVHPREWSVLAQALRDQDRRAEEEEKKEKTEKPQ